MVTSLGSRLPNVVARSVVLAVAVLLVITLANVLSNVTNTGSGGISYRYAGSISLAGNTLTAYVPDGEGYRPGSRQLCLSSSKLGQVTSGELICLTTPFDSGGQLRFTDDIGLMALVVWEEPSWRIEPHQMAEIQLESVSFMAAVRLLDHPYEQNQCFQVSFRTTDDQPAMSMYIRHIDHAVYSEEDSATSGSSVERPEETQCPEMK